VKGLPITLSQLEELFAASLHERNQEFYALADRFGIESYDGMDVGAVEDGGDGP